MSWVSNRSKYWSKRGGGSLQGGEIQIWQLGVFEIVQWAMKMMYSLFTKAWIQLLPDCIQSMHLSSQEIIQNLFAKDFWPARYQLFNGRNSFPPAGNSHASIPHCTIYLPAAIVSHPSPSWTDKSPCSLSSLLPFSQSCCRPNVPSGTPPGFYSQSARAMLPQAIVEPLDGAIQWNKSCSLWSAHVWGTRAPC